MIRANAEFLGILPSLEVLPFFARDSDDPCGGPAFPFRLKAFSSYGEISRDMLTRKLMGGIIPWEIFISDVLALPGQRADWKVLLFLHACPTELVLREPIHKAFYPAQSNARTKLPTRLTIGVESQNSLTKAQSREWLNHWKNSRSIELTFRMLPMDLMIQALEAEALDAIIALGHPRGSYRSRQTRSEVHSGKIRPATRHDMPSGFSRIASIAVPLISRNNRRCTQQVEETRCLHQCHLTADGMRKTISPPGHPRTGSHGSLVHQLESRCRAGHRKTGKRVDVTRRLRSASRPSRPQRANRAPASAILTEIC